VKREPDDPEIFGSKGRFAGVASLTRTLGSSGEPGRPSCSAVQHSLDAIVLVQENWPCSSRMEVDNLDSEPTWSDCHILGRSTIDRKLRTYNEDR
jgi:hypothetical protein